MSYYDKVTHKASLLAVLKTYATIEFPYAGKLRCSTTGHHRQLRATRIDRWGRETTQSYPFTRVGLDEALDWLFNRKAEANAEEVSK